MARKVTHEFKTEDYARGFAAGVEYVNDSALSVLSVGQDGERWVVTVRDEDGVLPEDEDRENLG